MRVGTLESQRRVENPVTTGSHLFIMEKKTEMSTKNRALTPLALFTALMALLWTALTTALVATIPLVTSTAGAWRCRSCSRRTVAHVPETE